MGVWKKVWEFGSMGVWKKVWEYGNMGVWKYGDEI
jgi:hypothetical protein